MRGAFVLLLSLTACADIADRIDRADIKPPAPTFLIPYPPSYVIGLPWCAGAGALVKMARVERRLTNGETWSLMGNCVVPFAGGYLVQHAWGDSPGWNEYPIDIAGPIDQVPEWQRR